MSISRLLLSAPALWPLLAWAQIYPNYQPWSSSTHRGATSSIPCPSGGQAAAITEWRDKQIARLVQPGADGQQAVSDVLACFGANPPKCLKGVESYAKELVTRKKGIRDNWDLFDPTQSYNILKSEADLPDEFMVKGLFGRRKKGLVQIPENILQIAKEKGWRTATYKTRSTGGFDAAPNLFILAIPGEERDIVMQIQLPPGGDGYDPVVTLPAGHAVTGQGTLTTITVDKTVNPPVGQLQIHRTNGNGQYEWNRQVQNGGGCMSCHASPLRPISPVGYVNQSGQERPMTPEHQAEIDAINEVLAQDGVSWGSYMKEGHEIHRGPARELMPLGYAPKNSPTRKEEFLRNCASGVEASTYSGFGGFRAELPAINTANVNWEKVASAMSCTTCHAQGKMRGPLTEHFSRSEIRFKVLVDRSMPEDEDLNMDERLALVACLEAERNDPAVKESWRTEGRWMKSGTCVDVTHDEGAAPGASH